MVAVRNVPLPPSTEENKKSNEISLSTGSICTIKQSTNILYCQGRFSNHKVFDIQRFDVITHYISAAATAAAAALSRHFNTRSVMEMSMSTTITIKAKENGNYV